MLKITPVYPEKYFLYVVLCVSVVQNEIRLGYKETYGEDDSG
jgi:hypothetical protein